MEQISETESFDLRVRMKERIQPKWSAGLRKKAISNLATAIAPSAFMMQTDLIWMPRIDLIHELRFNLAATRFFKELVAVFVS